MYTLNMNTIVAMKSGKILENDIVTNRFGDISQWFPNFSMQQKTLGPLNSKLKPAQMLLIHWLSSGIWDSVFKKFSVDADVSEKAHFEKTGLT